MDTGMKVCSIVGCGKKRVGKGFCGTHLTRFKRHGDPLVVLPRTKKTPRTVAADRQPFYSDGCWLVPLTQGKFAKIDGEDVERVSAYTWYARWDRVSFYARTKVGGRDHNVSIEMHRFISGAPQDKTVDHLNHDGLDNRRDNLRVVEHQVNRSNTTISASNRTGFKGVGYARRARKFRARINISGKEVMIGWFGSAESAARAYDAFVAERGIVTVTNAALGLL